MMSGLIGAATVLVLVTVVLPLWIVAHYATKWRAARALQPEDESRFAELHALLERLEQRMDSVERILERDGDTAGGRERHGA